MSQNHMHNRDRIDTCGADVEWLPEIQQYIWYQRYNNNTCTTNRWWQDLWRLLHTNLKSRSSSYCRSVKSGWKIVAILSTKIFATCSKNQFPISRRWRWTMQFFSSYLAPRGLDAPWLTQHQQREHLLALSSQMYLTCLSPTRRRDHAYLSAAQLTTKSTLMVCENVKLTFDRCGSK